MHTAPITCPAPRRFVALGLLAALTALGACARHARVAPDGTEAAPFDVRDVDVPPRLLECAPGTFRLPLGTPGGSSYLAAYKLVVRADGTVDPKSVRPSGQTATLDQQKRVGQTPDLAIQTCRFEPAQRAGQPVAVRIARTFGAP